MLSLPAAPPPPPPPHPVWLQRKTYDRHPTRLSHSLDVVIIHYRSIEIGYDYPPFFGQERKSLWGAEWNISELCSFFFTLKFLWCLCYEVLLKSVFNAIRLWPCACVCVCVCVSPPWDSYHSVLLGYWGCFLATTGHWSPKAEFKMANRLVISQLARFLIRV